MITHRMSQQQSDTLDRRFWDEIWTDEHHSPARHMQHEGSRHLRWSLSPRGWPNHTAKKNQSVFNIHIFYIISKCRATATRKVLQYYIFVIIERKQVQMFYGSGTVAHTASEWRNTCLAG